MSAALVVPAQLIVGAPLTVTGTGFDISEEIDLTIANPEETLGIVLKVTSDGAGAIDISTVAVVTPQREGTYTVSSVDPDGGGVVKATCAVFAS